MPRIPASERDAFVERRREEILEAAGKLWARQGFDATSLESIAAEVGLTKGTLYLYFPGKQALLDEFLRRRSLQPDVAWIAERLRDRSLEELVRLLVETAWERLRGLEDLVRVFLRELPPDPERARHFLAEVVLPTNRMLAELLAEKLPPGRTERIDPLVATRGLVGMVLVLFTSQVVLGGGRILPIPEERIVDTITELFLNGVVGGGA